VYFLPQTYAEMDPTTAALEKEHEAVRISRSGEQMGYSLSFLLFLMNSELCPVHLLGTRITGNATTPIVI